jgi:PAS domain S-box-containing protein
VAHDAPAAHDAHDAAAPAAGAVAPAAGAVAGGGARAGNGQPGPVVPGPDGVFAALRQDGEQALGFRPTRVAGRPAVEVVGSEGAVAGYAAALHAALAAAAAQDRTGLAPSSGDAPAPDGTPSRDDPPSPDGTPPWDDARSSDDLRPPEDVLLRLDLPARGAPRVRLAEHADDDLSLLSQAEVVGAVGSWELRVPSGTLRWSENLFRIYGFDPQGPTPTLEAVIDALHPDDRERVAREVEEMRRRGTLVRPLRQRVVRPSGEVRHLRATLGIVEVDAAGEPRRFVGSVQDVTERLRAEQEIATHLAVSEGLAEWQGLEPSAQRLLDRLANAMGGVGGVLWVPEDGHLVARVVWPDRCSPLDAYWAATRRTRLRPGGCVPGTAWERGEPVFVVGGTRADHGPRWEAVRQDGVRGSVAIPALNGRDVVAVIELAFLEHAQITDRLVRSLTGIGHELGQFFGRRQGELGAASLTARELEVLQLSSQGMTTRATADALFVSPATVKTHLSNIYVKLGVADRAAAVASALRLGLIR